MSKLSDKLDTLDITIKSTHIRLHAQDGDDNYLMDEWECVITYGGEADKKSLTIPFKSGIGNRELSARVRKQGHTYIDKFNGQWLADNADDAARAGYTKPVPPNVADVLSCHLCDAYSAQETFYDYCANYGVSPDSREQLDTYLRMQKTLIDLRRMFGWDLYVELSGLEH